MTPARADRPLHDLTAVELSLALARRETDPVEVLEHVLGRAGLPAAEHAFLTLTTDRAFDEARASSARHRAGRPLGRLDGLPIAWKGVFDVRGAVTTAGSATRRDNPPATHDAHAVALLARAGAVTVGTTNLSELAYSGLGLNPHFGTPRNPSAPGAPRAPGGSSSGSAVAVAAGALPWAAATDTSGSVRVPASFCGLVGYRPSAARIDRAGVVPLAPSLDTVGPIARTVADANLLEAAMAGLEPATLPGPAPSTLVVAAGEFSDDVDTGVTERIEHAIAVIEQHGVTVRRRRLRALDEVADRLDRLGTLVAAEAYRTHADLLHSPAADALDPRIRARLLAGHVVTGQHAALLAERRRLRMLLEAELGATVVALPTVRHTAPLLADLDDDLRFAELNARTLRTTMVTSCLDMPGVTLPVGTDQSGAPVGLLLTASTEHDHDVLRMAHAVETMMRPEG